MSVAILIIDAVLLIGIIGVSVYGARTLPPDARLPLHFGPAGYTNWQPKNFALVLWPVIGIVVYIALVVTTHRQHSGHGLPVPVVLTALLVIMLGSHAGALQAANRRMGRG
jgi:hypothetical protein